MSAPQEHQERLDDVKIKMRVTKDFGWQPLSESRGRKFLVRDQHGKILWLKVRTGRKATSWDWPTPRADYDALIGILASHKPEYGLRLVIRVARQDVERLKHENQDSDRLRWNEDTRSDPAVEVLYSRDA